MKRLIIVGIGLVLVLAAGGGWLANWYHRNLLPPSESTQTTLFRIEAGTSSFAIAKNLKNADLIKSSGALDLYLFNHGLATHMQAGLYRLSHNLPAADVARIISSGQTAAITVTVTPGERLSQIVASLKPNYSKSAINRALKASYHYGVLAQKPKGASLEGYLFPDTYRIEVDKTATDLVDLMLANTDQKISAQIRRAWRKQGLNLHQGLTLASIVTKETPIYADQTQVAQVYLKRLAIGMKLEADPTYYYAAAEAGLGASPSIQSPYNTYLHHGLPPTPIGAVTIDAAAAVGHPARTNWLYFVADRTGVTHFARTLDEHKRNVAKYR